MLRKETVEPNTLGLLKKIMEIDALKDFALLGGTSLSLRWGHRRSEDLDLFSNVLFDEGLILQELENNFSNVIVDVQEKQTMRLRIEEVKVEIISPKKPYLKPFELIEDIRFFSVDDAMAFKMNAIERRGSKKDFFDLYECLKYYDFEDIISFYQKKFETTNIVQLLKSITYFGDAELYPNPISFSKITWENIKEEITEKFDLYIKKN